MNLYLTGVTPAVHYQQLAEIPGVRFMISYLDCEPGADKFEHYIEFCGAAGVPLLLDCGAFSAIKQGVAIKVTEYGDFLEAYGSYFEVVSNLSVPGSTSLTWRNFNTLRKRGFDPMPIFNVGEDWKQLERLAAAATGMIGLGGMEPYLGQRKNLMRWIADCFRRMDDPHVHGFGITTPMLMASVPWVSVDSPAWLGPRRWGRIVRKDHRKLVTATKKQMRKDPVLVSKMLGHVPLDPSGGLDMIVGDVAGARAMTDWNDELTRWRENPANLST